VDDEQGIAATAVAAQNFLKKKGISETTLNILEGLNAIFPSKVPNQQMDEWGDRVHGCRPDGARGSPGEIVAPCFAHVI
jgi:hypothetical protein